MVQACPVFPEQKERQEFLDMEPRAREARKGYLGYMENPEGKDRQARKGLMELLASPELKETQ